MGEQTHPLIYILYMYSITDVPPGKSFKCLAVCEFESLNPYLYE